MMVPTKGFATHSAAEPLKPFSSERRDPRPNDVQIEILFCGVNHSDLHIVRDEWGGTQTGLFNPPRPDKPTCRSVADARNPAATSSRFVELR